MSGDDVRRQRQQRVFATFSFRHRLVPDLSRGSAENIAQSMLLRLQFEARNGPPSLDKD
jgi:hypothetical protein